MVWFSAVQCWFVSGSNNATGICKQAWTNCTEHIHVVFTLLSQHCHVYRIEHIVTKHCQCANRLLASRNPVSGSGADGSGIRKSPRVPMSPTSTTTTTTTTTTTDIRRREWVKTCFKMGRRFSLKIVDDTLKKVFFKVRKLPPIHVIQPLLTFTHFTFNFHMFTHFTFTLLFISLSLSVGSAYWNNTFTFLFISLSFSYISLSCSYISLSLSVGSAHWNNTRLLHHRSSPPHSALCQWLPAAWGGNFRKWRDGEHYDHENQNWKYEDKYENSNVTQEQHFQYVWDPEYLLSPTTGPAKLERAAMEEAFPINYDYFQVCHRYHCHCRHHHQIMKCCNLCTSSCCFVIWHQDLVLSSYGSASVFKYQPHIQFTQCKPLSS